MAKWELHGIVFLFFLHPGTDHYLWWLNRLGLTAIILKEIAIICISHNLIYKCRQIANILLSFWISLYQWGQPKGTRLNIYGRFCWQCHQMRQLYLFDKTDIGKLSIRGDHLQLKKVTNLTICYCNTYHTEKCQNIVITLYFVVAGVSHLWC